MNVVLKKVTSEKVLEVLALLTAANLPTNDIDEGVELFFLEAKEQVIATAGLEIKDKVGLLRSVSVLQNQKGKGYGQLIARELEAYAKTQHIEQLYLLTTSAKEFFEQKCNYEVVERTNVPLEIQHSRQFSSVCPASAVVMKKNLV